MALPFAIMFPMLLMFFSFALDGAHFQSNRARLADAMNQGVLATAINDRCDYVADKECAVKHGNKDANEKVLSHYLNYYLPYVTYTKNGLDVIVSLNRDNSEKLTSIDYNASGNAILHPIFKKYNEVGFDDNILVRADSSAGTVRKSMEQKSLPTDFVFVVDVSSSMGLDINDKSTNIKDDAKYEILKKEVVKFSQDILNSNEKNTIGIVPFNIGVPVKSSKKIFLVEKRPAVILSVSLRKSMLRLAMKRLILIFGITRTSRLIIKISKNRMRQSPLIINQSSNTLFRLAWNKWLMIKNGA